jgi:thiamine pyrophosphate-dependent acetolactate synthase large subunit-like protein
MIPLIDALEVIHQYRQDAVVITTMGAAREWQKLEPHPKDLVYMPSSMGQGPPLGLGIALAKPNQRVIVVNGDGCLLMNLGCLVTITAQAPKNFTLIVVDNGVYEVTGGQATVGDKSKRVGSDPVNFADLARAAGFTEVYEFDDAEAFRFEQETLHEEGPVCIVLKTTHQTEDISARSPGPPAERIQCFKKRLL